MANVATYGFLDLKHLFAERVEDVGVQQIDTAITRTVEEHNRQVAAILELFAERTTDYQIRYTTPQAIRLQPMDENGRALPVQTGGAYTVGFPILEAAAAWGANFVTRQKMTVAEANRITSMLISADMRWIRDQVMAGLFSNVSWTFPDPEHGDVVIKGLANADTDTYLIQGGADAGLTDDHYGGQAAAIDDSNNPFPTIEEELMEHPENSGQVVSIIATAQKNSVRALTNFVEPADPNIVLGSNADRLTGGPGVTVPGTLIGYVDGCWIVEWKSLPSGYIISVTTGGEPPLAMREDEETSLRGFQRVAERSDHPFLESQWLRRAGFGALNRVGAHVMEIGDATYDIPTGYEAPVR